jgi:hypothetical protein
MEMLWNKYVARVALFCLNWNLSVHVSDTDKSSNVYVSSADEPSGRYGCGKAMPSAFGFGGLPTQFWQGTPLTAAESDTNALMIAGVEDVAILDGSGCQYNIALSASAISRTDAPARFGCWDSPAGPAPAGNPAVSGPEAPVPVQAPSNTAITKAALDPAIRINCLCP